MGEAKRSDDGSYTVTLSKPLASEGGTLREIKLRGEMTVADLEAMDRSKGEVGKTIRLIGELSGLGLGTIRRLDAKDYASVAGVVARILGKDEDSEIGES